MSPFEAGSTTQSSWRTARLCTGGECVEVAQHGDMILLRDSVQPQGAVLSSAAEKWRSFVGDIKAGSFDGLRP